MAKVGVELVGAGKVLDQLRGIAHRSKNPSGAFQAVFTALERGEREVFAGYGGKYVKTGATMASLTQPEATGAIREHHGGQFRFGSSVWYAKFQGTTGPGKHHSPSAILRLTPDSATRAAKAVDGYVFHGRRTL